MKLGQRLERVEAASTETELRRYAERLTDEWAIPVEQLFRHLLENHYRIERHGIDEELRRIASESGHSEEKVRADYEEALATLPKLGDDE